MAEEKRKEFKILIYTDVTKEDAGRFNLVLQPRVAESIWEQIYEMAEMVGAGDAAFEICIEGQLGSKTIERVCELANKGKVVWKLPAHCMADAFQKLTGQKTKFGITVERMT